MWAQPFKFSRKKKILKSVIQLSTSDRENVARTVVLLKPEVNLLSIKLKIRLHPQEIQTVR